jgi:aldose 1-epimerase
LTHLFVKDKNGQDVDVVLGYDNITRYRKCFIISISLQTPARHPRIEFVTNTWLEATDPGHPVYNAVPGRYVSRIKDGEFTIDGTEFKTEQNDGNNTLHSGTNNWSFRMWNVTASSRSSITFSLFDKEGSSKGFPGDVEATVTYTLDGPTWKISMQATATKKTRKFPNTTWLGGFSKTCLANARG